MRSLIVPCAETLYSAPAVFLPPTGLLLPPSLAAAASGIYSLPCRPGMSAVVLEALKTRAASSVARIAALEAEVAQQEVDIRAADEVLRKQEARKSQALLAFLKRHAEEEAQSMALSEVRSSTAAAWAHIEELQTRHRVVAQEQAECLTVDAERQARWSEHLRTRARIEAAMTSTAQALQSECDDIIARLQSDDEQRTQCATREAERLARMKDAEAIAIAPTPHEPTDAEVESLILGIIAERGKCDAVAVLHALSCGGSGVDLDRVHRALHSLQAESFAIYEVLPGEYASL